MINISQYEEKFLEMIQKNINIFSKKNPLQVIYKRGSRTEVQRLRESIKIISMQIDGLEKIKKCQEHKLEKALGIK